MSLQHSSEPQNTAPQSQAQVCGSIIDAQGKEIPITEQMIQEACKHLEQNRVDLSQKG
ncbi:MAG TPA: hypothetical protein VJS90_00715 [Pseudomonas sp.]|uniref:PA1571 family protein n=1 Tax=Pseudomonas sp. TaxID=306 RepID=UPI002B473413|nr:PA1571 family protein [Pseudomonas sp.]HKS11535.1 hypothetical protein [Pseudomonas sp.]